MSRHRILMIAYHYPPAGASSGVHRTLKFSQYLDDFGWKPIVLTGASHMYETTDPCQLEDVPDDICVKRAWGLDAARHLSIAGHYPGWLALPDRWSSWWLGGVVSGLHLIRKLKPDVIWSTYPFATAHLIGLTLHRLSGLPWVADFRDAMVDEVFPYQGRKRRLYQGIERRVVHAAARVVVTTPGTRRMYAERYPALPTQRWSVIANGYDEQDFARLAVPSSRSVNPVGKLRLLHSGLLYPLERDPQNFFAALAALKDAGVVSPANLEIVLRAAGHEDQFLPMIERFGVSDIVFLKPHLAYKSAIREMTGVDGLLIFQAANCNHQIPAKVYEYLRARRPILAMTDPQGDTAALLREVEGGMQVPLDSRDAIRHGLEVFITRVREGTAPMVSQKIANRHTRYARTAMLAGLLDDLV